MCETGHPDQRSSRQTEAWQPQRLSRHPERNTDSLHDQINCTDSFEYTYKWWRGNCENSPLPTIGSAFQCVKVDLPFCIDVCMWAYVLKWYSAHFFFGWKRIIYLLSRTETTAQCYLWLNRRTVVKGIQIAFPSFICILKDWPQVTVD